MKHSRARACRRFAFKHLYFGNTRTQPYSSRIAALGLAMAIIFVGSMFPTSAQHAELKSKPSASHFLQDFSASTVVADYVSATPNSGQFNAIGSTGAAMLVSINGGSLQYDRTGGNSGSYSRTTDFAPTPATLKYSFDLTVAGNTAAQTSAAVFQIGSGFGVGNSTEPIANTFSRFGVNFTAATGQWSVRDIGASVNSPNFVGTQTVSWFSNNSGAPLSYLAPDGTSEPLADNTADLWVGMSRVFNDYAATTPTQQLTDMKFVFSAGIGTIQLDNIQVEDIAGPTQAVVSINGRVTDASGNAVRDAIVILEGGMLGDPRICRVNTFGYYRFDGLQPGTYNVSVGSKRSTFDVPTRTITLQDTVTLLDFVADPW